jgi:prepilin peptidase CpaA
MFSLPPQKVEMVLLLVLLSAAIYDVRYRRIPNWITVSGVVIGLAMNWIIGPPDAGILFALEGLGAAFGFYLILYLLRAMGAGDVKLMAAVGALVGPTRWFGIFLVTAIIGGIMAMVLIVMRRRTMKTFWNIGFILSEMRFGRAGYTGKEELDVRSGKSMGLPHGAIIAIGCIFYLAIAANLAR